MDEDDVKALVLKVARIIGLGIVCGGSGDGAEYRINRYMRLSKEIAEDEPGSGPESS